MNEVVEKPTYLKSVKQQYEDYPYPLRNPEDEKTRLVCPGIECLDRLSYYGFSGKRNFQKDFRALVAGGGTGDAAIFLAEQLRGSDAEIVYIDLSNSSMEIAKERAKIRSLDNIQWHLASIFDIPNLNLGMFDYINCSGVLHHLKDPDAGLAALSSVLNEDGVMGIMLYGQYGRTGVYHMQEMMRLIGKDDPIEERIADCKSVLNRLPKTHWYCHNHKSFGDVSLFGDIGIYDLFLHSQDRAYTIPELYDYAEKQGLMVLKLFGMSHYDITRHINDPALLERINSKDEKTRYAIGELLSGTANKHLCYLGRGSREKPSADDLNMVPSFPINRDSVSYKKLLESVKQVKGSRIQFESDIGKVQVPKNPELIACLKYMDGHRSIKEIYQKVTSTSKFERSTLREVFSHFCHTLAEIELLFLRHKDVPKYKTLQELDSRLD